MGSPATLIRNVTALGSSRQDAEPMSRKRSTRPPYLLQDTVVARNSGRITDHPPLLEALNASVPTLIPQPSSRSCPWELGRGGTGRGCGCARPRGRWEPLHGNQLD